MASIFRWDPARIKRKGMFALAVALFVLAAIGLYVGMHNLAFRSLGLLASAAGAYLSRKSMGLTPSVTTGITDGKASNPPRRFNWPLIALSLLLMGIASFLLYEDAVNSYQQTWPVWVFVVVMFVCGGYLATVGL